MKSSSIWVLRTEKVVLPQSMLWKMISYVTFLKRIKRTKNNKNGIVNIKRFAEAQIIGKEALFFTNSTQHVIVIKEADLMSWWTTKESFSQLLFYVNNRDTLYKQFSERFFEQRITRIGLITNSLVTKSNWKIEIWEVWKINILVP